MARRIHGPRLTAGETALDDAQAHHARIVLRLADGAAVEVFDDRGATAAALLRFAGDGAAVDVRGEIREPVRRGSLVVVSAVPKGDRADWMAEKLSELGVSEWIPLAAERSVVLPQGNGKRDRWARIATEAAKQSRRAGVMRIGPLTKLPATLASLASDPSHRPVAWCLSTEEPDAPSATRLMQQVAPETSLVAFVGPEGGWTPDELKAFAATGVAFVRLTDTVLRIETAAVTVAAIVAGARAGH